MKTCAAPFARRLSALAGALLLAAALLAAPRALSGDGEGDEEAAATPIRVAIYDDGGTGEPGPSNMERSLEASSSYRSRRVTAAEIREGTLKDADVIIVPGGSASSEAAALDAGGREAVRRFVGKGGGYVGFCAGAYLATADYEWSLGILDAKVIDKQHWARGTGEVEIRLTKAGKEIFDTPDDIVRVGYFQGPLLAPAKNGAIPDYEVVASYETEIAKKGAPSGVMKGTTAIARGRYGLGRVLAFSPHPEKTEALRELVRRAVRWSAGKDAEAGDDAPQDGGDYGAYWTMAEIEARIAQWARDYPSIVTLTSIGKTHEGRAIPIVKISDHPERDEDEPELLVLSGMHPREQPPQVALMKLVEEEILAKYGKDARATRLVDGRELWVLPIANVDGKVHDFEKGGGKAASWRKTRRPNQDGTVGTDLNRNFPHRWGGSSDLGTSKVSDSPKSDYYEGLAPFSEAEARALDAFLAERPLRLLLDMHSPFRAIFAPSWTYGPETERISRLLAGMRERQDFPYDVTEIQGDRNPPAKRGNETGILRDWAYYAYGITGVVFELHADPKWYPTKGQILNEYERNVKEPVLWLLEEGAKLPLATTGTARCERGRLDGKLAPGKTVRWLPEIEGAVDWAFLSSRDWSMRVTSEVRIVPAKVAARDIARDGFVIEVSKLAEPGREVPVELYMWDRERRRSVARFTWTVEAP